MATTQREDPNERVDHPRHYNQHPSGIECIELIEHLPGNLSNAVKYIWRCGLKATETPLRDLNSAKWYTRREQQRVRFYELKHEPEPKTDIVWRALAHRIVELEPESALGDYLIYLLDYDFPSMLDSIDAAIEGLEASGG